MNVIPSLAIDFGNRTALAWDGKKVYKLTSTSEKIPHTSIAQLPSSKEVVYLGCDGQAYVVGSNTGNPTYFTNKPDVAIPLFLGVMTQLPNVDVIEELTVIDSLPEENLEYYVRALQKEHYFDYTDRKGVVHSRVIKVNRLNLIKEGYGALLQEKRLKGDQIVINLGGGTFDFISFKNGLVVDGGTTNLKREGGINFQHRLQIALRKEGIITFNIEPEQIFEALENGYQLDLTTALDDDSRIVNIENIAKAVCVEWVKEKTSKVLKLLKSKKPAPILLTGGLSYLVMDYYKDNKKVTVAKTPDVANVKVF